MAIPSTQIIGARGQWRPTVFVIIRAALGLARHGLRHPLRPASICRLTGKVTAR